MITKDIEDAAKEHLRKYPNFDIESFLEWALNKKRKGWMTQMVNKHGVDISFLNKKRKRQRSFIRYVESS